MLLAFLLNGVCPFGLRVLAGKGLAGELTQVYLFYWYLGGLVLAVGWALRTRQGPTRQTLLIGSLMAIASVGGQFSMGMALAHGTPGNVVYMISQGASICVVVAGGAIFFKEKVGAYGKAGIALGILAAILSGVWN
jgi:multidrug transporter EmrE-like cation transporter